MGIRNLQRAARGKDVVAATGILALAAVALIPLFQPGIAQSDDILVSIYRVFALQESWQEGLFYPRFAPVLAFGYGEALFHFYPPLASYVAATFALAGTGVVTGVKITFALALALSGLGAYQLGRTLLPTRRGAILAAIAYMLAPYQLANIYVRGAAAEALALAFFPWLLWIFLRLITDGGASWFAGASLGLAGLLITHNAQSLFFLPVLVLFCVVLARQQRNWGRVWPGLFAIALALGISSFFWLPALLEQATVNLAAMTQGYYDPVNHLVTWQELIQPAWLFDYGRPLVFHWGWLPALLAGCALLTWPRQAQGVRAWLALWGALAVVVLLLQLPDAAIVWRSVPLARFIQFPWRLLAFATLAGALLIGALPEAFTARRSRSVGPPDPAPRGKWDPQWLPRAVTGICAVALIVYALGQLWPLVTAERDRGLFTETDLNQRDMYERGKLGFELFSDYAPRTVQSAMTAIPTSPPPGQTAKNTARSLPEIALDRYRGFSLSARVTAVEPTELLLNRFYLPGWWATVDGQQAPIQPTGNLGLVTVAIPAGSHTVRAELGATPIQWWSSRLALLSLLLWSVIAVLGVRRRTPSTALVMALVLLTVSVGAGLTVLSASVAPPAPVVATSANVGDVAELLGYSLDRPQVHAGETIQLTLYWRSLQATNQEYKVFVHLRDLSDTQMAGQHDGAPVYGFTPTTRWQHGEILDDVHAIKLDGGLAPGVYQLAVGMYDPATLQNLPVSGAARTLPGQRIVLGEVEVIDP